VFTFDNRFLNELPGDTTGDLRPKQTHEVCWAAVMPTPVAQPNLLAYSPEVQQLLNLTDGALHSDEFLQAFSGNCLLPTMKPYATCYGGHQFGHWAGQLGDGRAIGLGEVINRAGQRWELQLKGAGLTPYSRGGDGRAVLRSSLREFLCSEAMHHLGIPTTRALSLISTGDEVVRDFLYDGHPQLEPGAIVCRVAQSFTRFGHFEILAARGDIKLLRRLVRFTISRDYPQLADEPVPAQFVNWFRLVCEKTATLVVDWLRVGFVHGVMNTDNMSILGLTIDYGPYGWMDNFDPEWTPNTTDAQQRRYALAEQPAVARWNLERLAEALEPVAPSQSILNEGLAHFDSTFQTALSTMLAAKFGLLNWQDGDANLVEEIFDLMQRAEVDMTEFFRALAACKQGAPALSIFANAFYSEPLKLQYTEQLNQWLQRYVSRLASQSETDENRRIRMNRVNPRFVLRNYLAQQAIDAAMREDLTLITKLMDAARHPYDENISPELTAKRPEWARNKAGCSMLSCSS
jgi:uncharacterized protein YdiU (UPF0061 family)